MIKKEREAQLRAILGDSYEPDHEQDTAMQIDRDHSSRTHKTSRLSHGCAKSNGVVPRRPSSDKKRSRENSANSDNVCDNNIASTSHASKEHDRRKTYVVSPAGFKTHPNTPNVDTGASGISGKIPGKNTGTGRTVAGRAKVAGSRGIPTSKASPRGGVIPKAGSSKGK